VDPRPSVTEHLHIHGWHEHAEQFDELQAYGSDAPALRGIIRDRPELGQPLDERLPMRAAQVVWGARHEMARTVEDVLARRTRSLLLDAQAAIDVAPEVARLMAEELDRDASWQQEQVEAFTEVADGYLMPDQQAAH
jgi:glycerol-3-phosphate dehydrogenase